MLTKETNFISKRRPCFSQQHLMTRASFDNCLEALSILDVQHKFLPSAGPPHHQSCRCWHNHQQSFNCYGTKWVGTPLENKTCCIALATTTLLSTTATWTFGHIVMIPGQIQWHLADHSHLHTAKFIRCLKLSHP